MNTQEEAPAPEAPTQLLPRVTYEQERATVFNRLAASRRAHLEATDRGDRLAMSAAMAEVQHASREIGELDHLLEAARRRKQRDSAAARVQVYHDVLQAVSAQMDAAVEDAARLDALIDEFAVLVARCRGRLEGGSRLVRHTWGRRLAENLAMNMPASRLTQALEHRVGNTRILPSLPVQHRVLPLEGQVRNWVARFLVVAQNGAPALPNSEEDAATRTRCSG